jgi:hypothetical protein
MGQFELHSGLTNGTPGTMFGRMEYSDPELLSPSPLLSLMTGMNGRALRRRSIAEIVQLPRSALRGRGMLQKKHRPRPNGTSYITDATMLCFTSKVETERSKLRDPPKLLAPDT